MMIDRTRWLTVGVIFLSIVTFAVLKQLVDPYVHPRLSISLSIIISTLFASVLLVFTFKPIKKQMVNTALSQEKYDETTTLLTSSKGELEEKNIMLSKKTKTLAELSRINKAMISTVELDKILGLIADAVQKELNFDRVIVFLLNNHVLEPKKGVGLAEMDLEKLKVSLKNKNNLIAKTITEAKPNINYTVEEEPLPPNFDELYKNIKPGLLALSPLISKDKVTGLFLVDNIVSQRRIEETEIRSLSVFTNQAGLAIDNARLFEIQKNFSSELKKQIGIAKKELEEAQVQLVKSERLSALGEMSAVVAHEVRNPMASIRAAAQRIGKKLSDDDYNKKYVGYIIEETDRLERVVKNILISSREVAPIIEVSDLNKLVRELLDFIQPEIESSQVHLIKVLQPTLPLVRLDTALMKQVLLNIIQNALHFMSETQRRELKVATMEDNKHVIIEIADTGPGIPQENIKKIFEPFYTTKPNGTGLGLAISQRIIESHKGVIEVYSRLDSGTTFKVVIPG